jgi:hypothetical protein
MSGWPVLDVAVGLIFVYLLLSLICTTINEGLMTQFRSRAKFLDKGILSLLGNPEIKKLFFEHPLIESYQNTKGDSVPRRIGRTLGMKSATSDQCPSYLSGFAFARTVHDLLTDPGCRTVMESIQNRAQTTAAASGQVGGGVAGQNPPNQGASIPSPNDEGATNKSQGQNAAAPDPYDRLREVLKAVLANAKNPDQELKLINQWYDDGMERVTGWYKRHAQAWVRVLAIVVVLVVNADTLRITKTLWTDPTVRAKVVDLAQQRVNRAKTANYQMDDSGTPNETQDVGSGQSQTIGDFGGEITDEERDAVGSLMGWDADRKERDTRTDENGQLLFRDEKGQLLWYKFAVFVVTEHWLGWLLSIVAISLGAAFWFDLLKRVMNIRNAGTTPEESKKTRGQEAANEA